MRRVIVVTLVVGAAWAAAAGADGGGPSPGPNWGAPGKVDAKRGVRYVALIGIENDTVLEAIRLRDGNIVRWRALRGAFGIPGVAWDGSIGGLSRDGKRLVLASPAYGATSFVSLDPRTMNVVARVHLRGAFAFDALSPDGSVMYLLQYAGAVPNGSSQPYAVRAFDWTTRKLVPGAIVDRREPDEKMNGMPMARTGNAAGWVYTLYQRPGKEPFVHALDTVHRRAFCVDLAWAHSDKWIGLVRLRVQGRTLTMRRGTDVVARMDTGSLKVSSP
jgi:hypothetical protein